MLSRETALKEIAARSLEEKAEKDLLERTPQMINGKSLVPSTERDIPRLHRLRAIAGVLETGERTYTILSKTYVIYNLESRTIVATHDPLKDGK